MKFSRSLAAYAVVVGLAQAQTPPVGFADEIVFSTGLSSPVGMCFLPDGRIIVCEQTTAAVKIWAGGTPATMVTVPNVSTGSERGLLSVAVDPQWPTRPYVYTWHSRSSPANMVLSMWTASGAGLTNPASTAVTLGSQYIIIGDAPDGAFNHNGGTIRFGPDGFLYVSIGDDANNCNAQNFSVLAGCMLRLDVSALPGVGAGPPAKSLLIPPGGNPFNSGTDNQKLHWAKGLRNPFRFHIDAPTGELYIADVGQNAWEEADRGMPTGGENFGWPWWEGNANNGAGLCGGQGGTVVTAPIATISHTGGATSIMSMTRYRNQGGLSDFGAAYDGDYFYTDYSDGLLRRMDWNPMTGTFASPVTWGTGYSATPDAALGPDGALYYVKQFGPAAIRRIRNTANSPIVSIVSGNAQAVNAGWSYFNPLRVQVTQFGAPMVGAPVTFTATAGAVTLPPMPILTDAMGFAEVTPSLGVTPTTNPVVSATTPGGNTVNFSGIWRGITTVYVSGVSLISTTVRHSQPNSPVSLAAEFTPPAGPFVSLPFGDIWTSVLGPLPTLLIFDGLGLVGAPNPAVKTNAASVYTLTINGLPPLGGVPVRIQAYAFDTLRSGYEFFMISNKVDVTLL